jgi:hypothetical protein
MSTSNAIPQEGDSRAHDKPSPLAAEPARSIEAPIVPQATISGRALVGVVAVMTFLASLTIGAVMLVRTAASEWQADVAREVTIQIRAAAGRDIETDVAKSVAIARAFPGVAEVRPYSKDETMRLLEPWLGRGLQFEELPLPRIIVRGCVRQSARRCLAPVSTTIVALSLACAPWRTQPLWAALSCFYWY